MTDDERDPSEAVRDALASITNDYEVRHELHAVPPHAVYEVVVGGRFAGESDEKKRAVCKVARGPRADPATEARVVEYVGRETGVPVPRILAVGEDWFVAEWCDGLNEDPTLDRDRARIMGAGLATLHDETAGDFEATGFPRADAGTLAVDARDSWAETVCDLLADRRDYLADVGYADVAEDVRSFVREHPDLLEGSVPPRGTNEASGSAASPGDPVLAHGNYLTDHVTVADGEVTCVIDWEHALVAPAEYDYWRTAMPLFGPAETEENQENRRAFREGYESVRLLPDGLADRADLYRLVNVVSYLKSLHLQRQKAGQEKARYARSYREFVRDAVENLREQVA